MDSKKLSWILLCIALIEFQSCTSEDSTTVFPETCKAIRDLEVTDTGDYPADGRYTLYFTGDENMPWEAYCYKMSRSEPKEYLTVAEGNTYSQVSTPGGVTETVYRRLRIDPKTLKIDLLDDTFAETNGEFTAVPDEREHIPVGWAGFGTYSENGGTTAHAAIDFTDTPFVMDESVLENDFFCTDHAGTDSDISISSDLVFVELAAGDGMSSNVTKSVADCDHLGEMDVFGEENYTSGSLPLQYVGTN